MRLHIFMVGTTVAHMFPTFLQAIRCTRQHRTPGMGEHHPARTAVYRAGVMDSQVSYVHHRPACEIRAINNTLPQLSMRPEASMRLRVQIYSPQMLQTHLLMCCSVIWGVWGPRASDSRPTRHCPSSCYCSMIVCGRRLHLERLVSNGAEPVKKPHLGPRERDPGLWPISSCSVMLWSRCLRFKVRSCTCVTETNRSYNDIMSVSALESTETDLHHT